MSEHPLRGTLPLAIAGGVVVAVAAAGREAEGRGESKRGAEQAAAEAWLAGLAREGGGR